MRSATTALALMFVASAVAHGQSRTSDPRVEQEVRAFRLELMDALKRKDRATLERSIADGFVFIHATGGSEKKKTYINKAALAPLRPKTRIRESRIFNYFFMKDARQS